MAGFPGIIIKIGSETRDAIQGINKVDKALGRAASNSRKTNAVIGQGAKLAAGALAGASVAAGAFAAKFAVDGVQAAAAEDKELASLANTLKNLGFDYATGKVNDWIDATARATTQTDSDLRPAFASLLTVTKDVTEAQDLLGLSIDLAAQKQIPLATATAAVAKAANGSFTALKKLVPGVNTLTELAAVVGGADAAAFNTLEGSVAAAAEAFGELQESFGHGFLDSMDSATGKTSDLTDALYDLGPAAESTGGALGNTVTALGWVAGGVTGLVDTIRQNPIGDALATSVGTIIGGPLAQLGSQLGDSEEALDNAARAAWSAADAYAAVAGAAASAIAATADAAAASTWNKGFVTTMNQANVATKRIRYFKRLHEREAKAAADAAAAKAAAATSSVKVARAAESRSQASALDLSYLDGPWSPTRSNRNRKIMERRADGRAAQRDARTGGRP